MKTIIILLLLGCSGLFFACQDITVGYLYTDIAGYTPDTLPIINVKKEIVRLQGILDAFKEQTVEQHEKLVELEKQLDVLRESMKAPQKEYDALLDELYDYENPPTPDREEEINAKLEELDIFFDEVWEQVYPIQDEQDEINEELKEIAEGLGMEDPAIMAKKISDYQDRIEFKLPWTSSRIQGVKGTEPLQYSIVSVKNESAENAALFNESLSIVGGGRMYVAYDVKAPVGVYTVSIKVENEGQSAVLEDIFTFVIETAEDATEGE